MDEVQSPDMNKRRLFTSHRTSAVYTQESENPIIDAQTSISIDERATRTLDCGDLYNSSFDNKPMA